MNIIGSYPNSKSKLLRLISCRWALVVRNIVGRAPSYLLLLTNASNLPSSVSLKLSDIFFFSNSNVIIILLVLLVSKFKDLDCSIILNLLKNKGCTLHLIEILAFSDDLIIKGISILVSF